MCVHVLSTVSVAADVICIQAGSIQVANSRVRLQTGKEGAQSLAVTAAVDEPLHGQPVRERVREDL